MSRMRTIVLGVSLLAMLMLAAAANASSSDNSPGAVYTLTNSAAGSSGSAGNVSVQAGALSIVNGGSISSALRPFMNLPASAGNSGGVAVNVGGLLSLSGSGSRIGTETNAGSTGNAGSITVKRSVAPPEHGRDQPRHHIQPTAPPSLGTTAVTAGTSTLQP